MKHRLPLLAAGLWLLATSSYGQASVAYYPFNNVFSVSSNPNRALWLDGRMETNTLFGSLVTTAAPMINVARRERVTYYTGVGVRFGLLNGLNNEDMLEGYSFHVGVRAVPVASVPNVRVAFELSPYARADFKSGIFYSYLGLVYEFRKRAR